MKISVQIEFDKTLEIFCSKRTAIIGRSSENDIIIPHSSVSRQHCKVELINDNIFITDLGSSNGTQLDGVKLSSGQKTKVMPSSMLVIGQLHTVISPEMPGPTSSISKSADESNSSSTTLKVGRIDLTNSEVKVDIFDMKKIKGAKNPISDKKIKNNVKAIKQSKMHLVILFFIISVIQVYLIQKAKH